MAGPDRQTRRVIAGAACIAAVVGIAMLVFFLEDIRDAFTRSYRLVALFPEAPDLVVDAPVWVAGKPVGRVTQVGLLPAAFDTIPMVSVTLKLPRHVQAQVRRDSYARLTSSRLIGERIVDVMPGSPELPALVDGDTIDIHVPQKFAALLERSQGVTAELDTLMALTDAIRAPLAARRRALEPAQRELALAQREAAQLMDALRSGPAGRAFRDEDLRASLARLGDHLAGVRPAIDNAAGRTDGAGREVRTAVDSLLLRFDLLAAEVARLERHVEEGDGFIGRLAVDTAIHVAADRARAELDSLVDAVRSNPFRFFRLRLW